MKKINDWFTAGLIAGIVGGMGLIIYNVVLLLLGVPAVTFWQAMGGLFYNKQLMKHWLSQVHGMIDALGVSGVNGVFLLLTLKVTGTDYFYTKSVALSAATAYFLFLAVYPNTGLIKDNPYTPWVALFGHMVFTGLLTGYVLTKIYSFDKQLGNETTGKQPGSEIMTDPPGSLVAALAPKVISEMECGECLSTVPEFNHASILAPDYPGETLSFTILKYKPGMKKVHFIKPKKLNQRSKLN